MLDSQIIILALTLMAVGAAAGFSAGLFGIGGGAIIVPALYYAFGRFGYSQDVIMHAAVATSSATIIITSVRSASGHNKHGAVDWTLIWPGNRARDIARSWGIWIGIGSLFAAMLIARYLSGSMLTLVFGVMASIISLQLIFGRPDWQLAKQVPNGGLIVPSVGVVVGSLSALMGIGGGAFCVTLMVLCGKNIHRAIGTASAIGLFISLPATLGFVVSGLGVAGRPAYSLGYVNLLGLVFIAGMSFLFIPLGVKTAHKTSQKYMRIIFGLCLFIVAVNMIRKVIMG
ncbi:MAG: sulfite exporter TauE/SafE family protein [Robiginitomaculum sp.]